MSESSSTLKISAQFPAPNILNTSSDFETCYAELVVDIGKATCSFLSV